MGEKTGSESLGVEAAEPRLLRFDDFRVDPTARVLWRGAVPVPLTPRAFSVLLILLERPGEVVAKDELLRRLWSRGAAEANLTQCVSALRKALGESASERRYVVTVPGRGYSFAAEVVAQADAPSPAREEALPVLPGRVTKRRLLQILAAVLLATGLVAVAWLFLSRAPLDPPAGKLDSRQPVRRRTLAVLGFRNLSNRQDAEWLAAVFPEMLTTELAAANRLRVVPSEALVRFRRGGETLDGQALARIRTAVGADLVVTGSFLVLGNAPQRRVRLDARVIQVKGGETVAFVAEVGREKDLFDLVARTGARLQEALGVSGLPPPAGPPPAR